MPDLNQLEAIALEQIRKAEAAVEKAENLKYLISVYQKVENRGSINIYADDDDFSPGSRYGTQLTINSGRAIPIGTDLYLKINKLVKAELLKEINILHPTPEGALPQTAKLPPIWSPDGA